MSHLVCVECTRELGEDETYSYGGKTYCKDCYFKGQYGPLTDQYMTCPNCGTTVHMYTIKCPKCHTHIHQTGTIKSRTPISMGRIAAYLLISLLVVVIAFSLPSVSYKGTAAYLTATLGTILSVHGLFGPFFTFLPFGIYTLENRLLAVLLGALETALGLYLVAWPML